LNEYLQFNLKVLKNDFITYDVIEIAEIVNVYIPLIHINNFLFEKFGSYEYKHSSTVLIESLLKETHNSDATHFYVNVENDIFQILILKNKKVTFFNTFGFKTREDFIYYILFVIEQLQMNPEEIKLTFLGDIDKESELYEIAYKYIKNINFFQPNYNIPAAFKLTNHSFYILLNQHK